MSGVQIFIWRPSHSLRQNQFCITKPNNQTLEERWLTYRWVIGRAMPYLVGNAIRFNQVIVCDMEQSMVDAIIDSINDPTSLLRFSKLRLDYYHLFEQKWNERVRV